MNLYQAFSQRTSIVCLSIPRMMLRRTERSPRTGWKQWDFIKINIKRLPADCTTLDIWNNFKQHGNIEFITIQEDRSGDRSSWGEVTFQPLPSEDFWSEGSVDFKTKNQLCRRVLVGISHSQVKKFTVASPVHANVVYHERMQLKGTKIEFGVLLERKKMLVMAARDQSVRLVLNLHYRMFEVYFSSTFASDNRTAIRDFRFEIPLEDKFTISKISGDIYVVDMPSPPRYSKQLNEAIEKLHSPGAKRWSVEDTWARQTDMVAHKNTIQMINRTPVALRKNLNAINLSRWTTFKITLSGDETCRKLTSTFEAALKDFNVPVHDESGFVCDQVPQAPASDPWNLLQTTNSTETMRSNVDQMAELTLPFAVRFQLEVCISHGWLSEYTLTQDFIQRLFALSQQKAIQLLLHIDGRQQRIFDPLTIFDDLQLNKPVLTKPIPEHCIEIRSAIVTATGLIINSPSVEITNRIIRKYKQYSERFLRVRFEDDTFRGQTKLYAPLNNKMILVFQRVKRVMRNGLKIGDVLYEFLAWGNSQLREHGACFFAAKDGVSANSIRAEMGTFDHEKVVAKRAARMGQCFSTTKPVRLHLPSITRYNTIPDVRIGRYTFTDGVGQISVLAANLIADQLKIKGPVPSVFQFRLGGCKGVLAVSRDLQGVDVKVRESQYKFSSLYPELEIIRWSQFWQPFLNRQLIICFSDLGVSDEVFLQRQETAVRALDAAMTDDKAAIKALRENVDPNQMTLSITDLIEAGFHRNGEPFVKATMQLWRAFTLKFLKEKAKIPIAKGAFVLGCVDETNTLCGHFDALQREIDLGRIMSTAEKILNLPEIFVQIMNPKTGQREVIEGVCVLARNPSLHRGDIRVVKAVDVEALHHLCDVVVMPQNGDRDLPSMCSGGDLDGDDYIVIWDQDLIPPEWNAEPFHYEPPPPRTAAGEISTNDIIDFFYDYLQNDSLGRIANQHLAAADYLTDGIQSPQCLKLLELHSMAVDYPKTGVPAILDRTHERVKWPHFMEKKRGQTYKSNKILGQLYDAVARVKFKPEYNDPFDSRIVGKLKPKESILADIQDLKNDFDNDMQRIMAQHDIRTEFEIWTTFVLDHSKASSEYKFHEEIGQLSKTLKEQYYEAICKLAGGRDYEKLVPFAVAAYQVTQAQVVIALEEVKKGLRGKDAEAMPFISFPWILQDVLIKIANSTSTETDQTRLTAEVRDGVLSECQTSCRFDDAGCVVLDAVAADALDPLLKNISHHLPDPYRGGPITSFDKTLSHSNVRAKQSINMPQGEGTVAVTDLKRTLHDTGADFVEPSIKQTSPQPADPALLSPAPIPASVTGVTEQDLENLSIHLSQAAIGAPELNPSPPKQTHYKMKRMADPKSMTVEQIEELGFMPEAL